MPDHFLNLVVCTEVPPEGMDDLVENALNHFRSLRIKKVSWLTEEGLPALEIKRCLERNGLIFSESFGVEMAADLMTIKDHFAQPSNLRIKPVEGEEALKTWIHVASIGFGVSPQFEDTWYEFFAEAACAFPFRTYLALVDGKPVATSQLFTSAGVAGIYNVTCLPEARRQGVGTAVVLAPLLEAREMGYRVAILQASSLGYNVYRRIGFQDFGKLSVYLWEHHAHQSVPNY